MASGLDRASRNTWWDGLYQEQLAELGRRLRYARLFLVGIVIVEILIPCGGAFAVWLMNYQEARAQRSLTALNILFPDPGLTFRIDQAQAQAWSALVMLLVVVGMKVVNASVIVASSWSVLASFRRAIRRKTLIPAPASAAPSLHRIAAEVAAAMGLEQLPMRIWLTLSPSFLPSVVELRGINLLVPLGFVGLANSDEASCRAILGHELAHVKHRDTQLWRRSQALTWSIYRINLPVALLVVLLLPVTAAVIVTAAPAGLDASFFLVGAGVLALIAGLPILLEYGAYRTTVNARRASEDAADLLSAIRTSPGDLSVAIERYVADDAEGPLHRSKRNRVARLHALITGNTEAIVDEKRRDPLARHVVMAIAAAAMGAALFVGVLHAYEPTTTLGWQPAGSYNPYDRNPEDNKWNVGVYSPDGKEIATASRDGHVARWNLADLQPVAIDIPGAQSNARAESRFRDPFARGGDEPERVATNRDITALAFAPDGMWLVAASPTGAAWVWSRQESAWTQVSNGFGLPERDTDDMVAIAPNGRRLAVQRSDGRAAFFDVAARAWVPFSPAVPLTRMAFAGDARHLAAVDRKHAVTWWDVTSAKRVVLGTAASAVHSIAVDREGHRVAVIDEPGVVTIYPTDGRAPWALAGKWEEPSALTFATGGLDALMIFARSGLTLWDFQRHQRRVLNVSGSAPAVSPAFTSLLTIGGEGEPVLTKLGLSREF